MSLLDLPEELRDKIWHDLDGPTSRKNFFSCCKLMQSSSVVRSRIAKVQVVLSRDADPWHIQGGSRLGADGRERRPLLLRVPQGSQPHTLSIKGSGCKLDGARLHRLLSLGTYKGGTEREEADKLLGGVSVLEVEGCNLAAAPDSLPAILLANCPLTTLRVLSYPRHWSMVEDVPHLRELMDECSDDDLYQEYMDMYFRKLEEAGILRSRGQVMCSMLQLLGGTVMRVECISHEVAVCEYMCDPHGPPLPLPHLVSCKMNHANFEDVLVFLCSLPTLRFLDVGCLHEQPKLEVSDTCLGCKELQMHDMMVMLNNLPLYLESHGSLEVCVGELSFLNAWCPNCFAMICGRISDVLEPLRALLLKDAQKLQLGWCLLMNEEDMPLFAMLMPSVRELQVAYDPRLQGLELFPSFLSSPFYFFNKLSWLDIYVDVSSELPETLAIRPSRRPVLTLSQAFIGAVTQAGCEFLRNLRFAPFAAGFHRPVSITLHFVVPYYNSQLPRMSLELLQSMAAILARWVEKEVGLFGDKLDRVHWKLCVHGKGNPEKPILSMCS